MDTQKEQNRKVLIIEDDPGHLYLLKKLLQKNRCTCSDRADGRAGLAEAMENDYDLIFVDIRLPEIDGFVIATRLRESGNKVPLIAVTAVSLEGIEQYAKAVGYSTLLQKPITEEMISNILNNIPLLHSQ